MLHDLITHGGAFVVFALMVPESAGIVIPSEPVMLAAGATLHPATAILAGTLGNLVGSLLLYEAGRRGRAEILGRPADKVYRRFGTNAVFLARLLPLARSFVSLPAGRAQVPLGLFVVLTTAGCAIWSALFVLAGATAGRAAAVAAAALLVVWLVGRTRRAA